MGMPRTLYLGGVDGFSSMFILRTVTLSLRSAAMSSSAGAICLHGPHHSAQKSTSTGLEALRTSESNDWSVTLSVAIWSPRLLCLLCYRAECRNRPGKRQGDLS